MSSQLVVIAGGSKGLGKELALQLISLGKLNRARRQQGGLPTFAILLSKCRTGANVTILARSLQPLQQTCGEMQALIRRPGQRADFASVDLTNPDQVRRIGFCCSTYNAHAAFRSLLL